MFDFLYKIITISDNDWIQLFLFLCIVMLLSGVVVLVISVINWAYGMIFKTD